MRKSNVVLSLFHFFTFLAFAYVYVYFSLFPLRSFFGNYGTSFLAFTPYLCFLGLFLSMASFLISLLGGPGKGKYVWSLIFEVFELGGSGFLFYLLFVSDRYQLDDFVFAQLAFFIPVLLWCLLLLLSLVFTIIAIVKCPSLSPAKAESVAPSAPAGKEEAKAPSTPAPTNEGNSPVESQPLPPLNSEEKTVDSLAPIIVGKDKEKEALPAVKAATPVSGGDSRFDARLIQLIGHYILSVLLLVVTFTIAFPWVYAGHQKWMAKHTVIEGNRLLFDGTGGQLIGNWIKWLLLSFITFGIYFLWVPLKLKNWQVKHLRFRKE